MSDINEFDHWVARLDGEDVGCEDGKPQSGYYRMGNNPVAIWMHDGAHVAKVGNSPTRTDLTTVFQIWERCHPTPITHEAYELALGGAPWPDQHPAVLEMGAKTPDSFELLRADIEKLKAEAAIMAVASNDDEAAQAGELASKLGELEKKADAQRREAKKPHEDAGKAVDKLWRPVIEEASDAKRDVKARVVEPYLKKKAEAAKAAAAAVGSTHDGKASTKGGRVALRPYTVVTVESPAEALRYFAGLNEPPPDLIDAVIVVARRMAGAGFKDIPGVKITTEQRAA